MFINKAQVKQFLLDHVKKRRAPWVCTRVSAETYDHVEAHMRTYLIGLVDQHPSNGKTFRP